MDDVLMTRAITIMQRLTSVTDRAALLIKNASSKPFCGAVMRQHLQELADHVAELDDVTQRILYEQLQLKQ